MSDVELLELAARNIEQVLRSRAGRRRNAHVTLPAVANLTPEQRVVRARISNIVHSDLLGIKAGGYAKRPRYGVGEATPERMKHAIAAGKWLATEQERFEDGRPTGLKHKRFKSQLEIWRERGAIDDATYEAAETFQADCDLALSASPNMIARYEHSIAASTRELLPQEIQVQHEARKQAAIRAVDSRLHLILGWIAEVSNNDVSADLVARHYWPGIQERSRLERFRVLLEFVGVQLACHYGCGRKHRWVVLAASRAAREISDMLAARAV